MAEITHGDLMALGRQIEESTRREVDNFRADVKEHFRHANERVDDLCARVDRAESTIAKMDKEMTAVRHDLSGHIGAGETFRRLVDAKATTNTPPSKGFVAGVVAAIVALSGLAAEAFHQYGADLLKRWLTGKP